MEQRFFRQSPDSVPAARRFVAEFLAALPAELISTAALLVSELATNAVLYGSGDYRISVTYSRATGCARVEVTDSGPGMPKRQWPDTRAEHGRGLQLVDALSQRWGLDSRAPGKAVWFELMVPTSALVSDR